MKLLHRLLKKVNMCALTPQKKSAVSWNIKAKKLRIYVTSFYNIRFNDVIN